MYLRSLGVVGAGVTQLLQADSADRRASDGLAQLGAP